MGGYGDDPHGEYIRIEFKTRLICKDKNNNNMKHRQFFSLIIYSLFISIILGCAAFKKANDFSKEEALFRQYAFLTKESYEYVLRNRTYKQEISQYIDTCTIFNFKSDYNRLKEPVILSPFLFNTKKNKAWIMVLNRTVDLKNKPVEYVSFVLASKSKKKWSFKLKKGYVKTFSYSQHSSGSFPILCEQEITLRVLREVIDLGYMEKNSNQIMDSFFEKNW